MTKAKEVASKASKFCPPPRELDDTLSSSVHLCPSVLLVASEVAFGCMVDKREETFMPADDDDLSGTHTVFTPPHPQKEVRRTRTTGTQYLDIDLDMHLSTNDLQAFAGQGHFSLSSLPLPPAPPFPHPRPPPCPSLLVRSQFSKSKNWSFWLFARTSASAFKFFSLLLDLAGNYVSTSFPHSRALALFSSSILFIIHLYLTLILVLILLIYLPPSLHWPSPSPAPPPSPPLSSLHEISWYGRVSVLCQALASLLHHGVSHSGDIQETKHRTKCLSPSIHQPQMFSN